MNGKDFSIHIGPHGKTFCHSDVEKIKDCLCSVHYSNCRVHPCVEDALKFRFENCTKSANDPGYWLYAKPINFKPLDTSNGNVLNSADDLKSVFLRYFPTKMPYNDFEVFPEKDDSNISIPINYDTTTTMRYATQELESTEITNVKNQEMHTSLFDASTVFNYSRNNRGYTLHSKSEKSKPLDTSYKNLPDRDVDIKSEILQHNTTELSYNDFKVLTEKNNSSNLLPINYDTTTTMRYVAQELESTEITSVKNLEMHMSLLHASTVSDVDNSGNNTGYVLHSKSEKSKSLDKSFENLPVTDINYNSDILEHNITKMSYNDFEVLTEMHNASNFMPINYETTVGLYQRELESFEQTYVKNSEMHKSLLDASKDFAVDNSGNDTLIYPDNETSLEIEESEPKISRIKNTYLVNVTNTADYELYVTEETGRTEKSKSFDTSSENFPDTDFNYNSDILEHNATEMPYNDFKVLTEKHNSSNSMPINYDTTARLYQSDLENPDKINFKHSKVRTSLLDGSKNFTFDNSGNDTLIYPDNGTSLEIEESKPKISRLKNTYIVDVTNSKNYELNITEENGRTENYSPLTHYISVLINSDKRATSSKFKAEAESTESTILNSNYSRINGTDRIISTRQSNFDYYTDDHNNSSDVSVTEVLNQNSPLFEKNIEFEDEKSSSKKPHYNVSYINLNVNVSDLTEFPSEATPISKLSKRIEVGNITLSTETSHHPSSYSSSKQTSSGLLKFIDTTSTGTFATDDTFSKLKIVTYQAPVMLEGDIFDVNATIADISSKTNHHPSSLYSSSKQTSSGLLKFIDTTATGTFATDDTFSKPKILTYQAPALLDGEMFDVNETIADISSEGSTFTKSLDTDVARHHSRASASATFATVDTFSKLKILTYQAPALLEGDIFDVNETIADISSEASTFTKSLDTELDVARQNSRASTISSEKYSESRFTQTEYFIKLMNFTEYVSGINEKTSLSPNVIHVNSKTNFSTSSEDTATENAISHQPKTMKPVLSVNTENKNSPIITRKTVTEVLLENSSATESNNIEDFSVSDMLGIKSSTTSSRQRRNATTSTTSSRITTSKTAISTPRTDNEVISSTVVETDQEGKHIPFSSTLARRTRTPPLIWNITARIHSHPSQTGSTGHIINLRYNQTNAEEFSSEERANLINAVVKFSERHYSEDERILRRNLIHLWLLRVFDVEYKNATLKFVKNVGNSSLKSVESFSFVVQNKWTNEIFPADIILTTLNSHAENLKKNLVHIKEISFSRGPVVQKHDPMPNAMKKRDIIILSTCMLILGLILVFVLCVVIYRRKKRNSASSFTDDRWHELVNVDFNPTVIDMPEEIRTNVQNQNLELYI